MLPQTKPHFEVISQFAELVLFNRIASPLMNSKKPNHFNLIFQNSSQNVYEQLNQSAMRNNKLNTIGVEICFFLQNQEFKTRQLVESWVINVHIPNRTIEVMTPRQRLSFDNQKSHKLCILQSRGISSFLLNTPLFQRFININSKITQELKNLISHNTLHHTIRYCEPELELKRNSDVFVQHIFPPISILCATGITGQLQIKVRYQNDLEKIKFSEQNFISEISENSIVNNPQTLLTKLLIPEPSYQNALTQESSNRTNNSSDKKEFEFPVQKSWRKGSMQPELTMKHRSRTKSFSTQIAVYSKKDDVVMITTAEDAIAIHQKSDEDLDFQMIQEEKYYQREIIELHDDWQMMDKDNHTVFLQRPKVQYKHTQFWKLILEKKNKVQRNIKHQNKILKFQILETILFVKES